MRGVEIIQALLLFPIVKLFSSKMRLFSQFSRFFFFSCFIISCRVVADDGDDTVQASDVWNIMPGTADGGCDNWKTVIDRWQDESGELVDNAASYLADYETDYRVRKAVQNFFKLKPSSPGTEGTVKVAPAHKVMFTRLKSMSSIPGQAA